jgi:dihydrofolate synthase/folylpolyglutamate synthase
MSAEALGIAATEVFGEDRVTVVRDLADAIERAATLAEAGEAFGDPLGSGAVLVTGSVVTVGEARSMLLRRARS